MRSGKDSRAVKCEDILQVSLTDKSSKVRGGEGSSSLVFRTVTSVIKMDRDINYNSQGAFY